MHRFSRAALRLIAAFAAAAATPVFAADPPPLSAYGELPALEQAVLSPGGNLAVLGQFNGKRMLLVLDPALKAIRAVEIPADTKIRRVDWAGDESVLIERSETIKMDTERFTVNKAEIFNVMILPIDSSQPVRTIFADEKKMVKSIFFGPVMRNVGGKWMSYVGGREMSELPSGEYTYDGSRTGLYAVDVLTNDPKRVASPPVGGIYRDWLIDENGKIAATLDWKEGNQTWSLENKSGDELASGRQPDGHVGVLAFGKDGTSVIYSENDAEDKVHWFEVPLDGSAPAREILADTSLDSFFTDPYSARLLGYRPDDEDNEVVFFDPARQAIVEAINKAFPTINPRLQDWTPDFSKIVISTNGNGDSGTWYLLDTKTKQSRSLGFERPQIGARVGPISTVDYKAADGTELRGILTLPPDREPTNLPLVMFPHGGPHAHDLARFDWWAQAFASRGYAVFQPNFRGSTDRDEAFEHAGDGEWGRKMQTDISDGLAELVRRGVADPKRVCIMGASYGGYAALAGVTLQQGLYRCSVAVAGVSDLKMRYDTERYESGHDRFYTKALERDLGDPDKLDEVSPRRFANRADAPILLVHGKDDTVVPFKQSSVMADALRDAGKPYEMVVLNKEDHWLSSADTRKQMLEAAVAFVEKYNPPQ